MEWDGIHKKPTDRGLEALKFLATPMSLEQVLEYIEQIKENNRKNRRKYFKKYSKIPHVAVRKRLSDQLRHALKNAGRVKQMSIITYIGCSIKELKRHMESKFKEGMTWENMGKWHIDHIRPCASFDLMNEEEIKKCFHYSNLQPLWAHENLRKSSEWNGKKHYYKK